MSTQTTLSPINIKDCAVSGVVIYRDRAEVKRVVHVSLKGGESDIVITGLSEAVDGDSIRVEGQGTATILDVIYSTKEEKTAVDTTECETTHKGLVEQIKEKDGELMHLEFRQRAIENQKKFLDKYSKHVVEVEQQHKIETSDGFSSAVDPSSVSTVLKFMEQFEGRLASLDERLKELENSKQKITEEKEVLVAKAKEVNPKLKNKVNSETIRSVKVTLHAVEECDITLVLSYVVSNASWSPAYDTRVFTKDKTIKLHYYGMIKQSTGEDWKDAEISLSTAQPDIGASPPQLGVHEIGFLRPRAMTVRRGLKFKAIPTSYASMNREYDPTIEDSYLDEDEEYFGGGQEIFRAASVGISKKSKSRRRSYSPPSLEIEVAKVTSGQLYNTTYKIPRTSTIPADNTEHKVTVAIIDLSPEFSYVSVPKKSPMSFLQGKVKNASSYALLTGPANVFLDNNFLAKSELSDTSPGEDFTCSLGVDQSIRVTTHPVTTVRGTTGRITKNNLITYTQVYSVKNTQANVVKLKVLDQVPLSSDDRLKVVMLDPDIKKPGTSVQFSHGSVVLNDDNNVEWSCAIPPGGVEIELKLVYSVEFPPNDIVEGLQS